MELQKWDFEKEMKSMAQSCCGFGKETARKRAAALFSKYSPIIVYSPETLDKSYIERNEYKKLFEIQKSGRIDYLGGFLLLSEIESVESDKDNINIRSRSGNVISFSKNEWHFLLKL